jgi:uncharacterized protein YndB with AHSA1/START domain
MPDIRHAIQISLPAESVYPLVSTAKGFTQWWAEDVTPLADAVELAFFKRTTLYRLRPTLLLAHKEADWLCETGKEWSGTHLHFQLEPTKSGTLVRFAHAGWLEQSDYFTSCNTTWGELMFRLKAAAEGHSCGPLFLRDSLAY